MADTPSLFELTSDFQTLINMGYPKITDKDSEEEKAAKQEEIATFEDTLNMIMECIADKADAYCYCLDTIKDRSNRLNAEIKRLTAWKKSLDNAEERMKEGLKNALVAMRESGMEKPEIVTDMHRITLVKNGGKQALEVIEEKVPDSFKRVILETDKEKICKALDAGETLDFAQYKPRGERANIR